MTIPDQEQVGNGFVINSVSQQCLQSIENIVSTNIDKWYQNNQTNVNDIVYTLPSNHSIIYENNDNRLFVVKQDGIYEFTYSDSTITPTTKIELSTNDELNKLWNAFTFIDGINKITYNDVLVGWVKCDDNETFLIQSTTAINYYISTVMDNLYCM